MPNGTKIARSLISYCQRTDCCSVGRSVEPVSCSSRSQGIQCSSKDPRDTDSWANAGATFAPIRATMKPRKEREKIEP
jgi:hypothetical protein